MRIQRIFAWPILGALAALPAAARADEVVLNGGEVVEGVVTTEGSAVHVRLDYGTISFRSSEVKEVRKKDSPLAELEARKAKLDRTKPAEVRALAEWADARGLDAQARSLYRVLLGLDPNDARVREKLGYRQREGRWLTEDEYMIAEGYVRYGGSWKTKAEVDALEAERRASAASREAAARESAARAAEAEAERERTKASAPPESTTEVVAGTTTLLPGIRVWPYVIPHRYKRPHAPAKPSGTPTMPANPRARPSKPAASPAQKSAVSP